MAKTRFTPIRRIIRGIEPAMRAEMAKEMRGVGHDILAAMQANAPVATGKFKNSLSASLNERSLTLKIGLVGKPINREVFYARILEGGRKAQTIAVSRGFDAQKAAASRLEGANMRLRVNSYRSTYLLHVRAFPPHRTVYARYTRLRVEFNQRLKGIWDRVLTRAAAGATDGSV